MAAESDLLSNKGRRKLVDNGYQFVIDKSSKVMTPFVNAALSEALW